MPPRRRFQSPQRFRGGRFSKNRLAWLHCVMGQFVVMKDYDVDELEKIQLDPEWGATYRLLIPRAGTRPVALNFTAMTHEEFVAFRKLFDLICELAEPVILERDRIAQDAFDKGDDSFNRSYRQIPQLVIREGALGADDQGVHDGPDDLPDGDLSEAEEVEEVRVSDGGVRGAGDELAPGEQEPPEPQDDESAPDESA